MRRLRNDHRLRGHVPAQANIHRPGRKARLQFLPPRLNDGNRNSPDTSPGPGGKPSTLNTRGDGETHGENGKNGKRQPRRRKTLDLILKPLLEEESPHDPYSYLIKLWTNADGGREVDRVNMEKTLSVNISTNLKMQDPGMPQSIAIVSHGGNLYDLDVEHATPKILIASVYDATMDIDEEQLFRNENPTGVYAVRMDPGDLRRKPKPEIPCPPDEELLNRLTQLLTHPGTATPKPGQVRRIWSRTHDTPTLDEIFQASSMAIQDGSHLNSSPVKKKTRHRNRLRPVVHPASQGNVHGGIPPHQAEPQEEDNRKRDHAKLRPSRQPGEQPRNLAGTNSPSTTSQIQSTPNHSPKWERVQTT